jgi:hypothetical protein
VNTRVKAAALISGACCLWLLAFTPDTRAQSFEPPVSTQRLLVLLDQEGSARFTLVGYYTAWVNPFRVSVSTSSAVANRVVTRNFRLTASTPASPLFGGTYLLSRRWGVGFWYNPVRDERLQTTVQVAEKFIPLDLQRDTDLMDVHVVYLAPHGLAAQVGYYREHGTIRDLGALPLPPRDYTLNSYNFWVTQRLDVFFRGRLVNPRLDAHLIPFISAGYHPAGGLDHAASILAGVTLTFKDRISLSGSIWQFDLARPATRITGGLGIQF